MKKFEDERQPVKGLLLRPRLLGRGLAALDPLVERQQIRPLVPRYDGLLLEQRLEFSPERQHDGFGFRTRIELRIGGQIVEVEQRRLAKFPNYPFPRQLPFNEATIGADHRWGKEGLGAREEPLEHGRFKRRL